MDVTEQIEEQRTADAPVPDLPPDVLAAAPPVEEPATVPPQPAQREWPVLNGAWLRMAYVFEFWIALVAIFTVWSQVGGQGHLDLIAWYIKLACALTLAWSAVRMTSGIVENARAWNRATVRWFVAVLVIATLIAGITYWYHLHEVSDEPDTDENSATVVRNDVLEQNFTRDLIVRERANC
jgi:hypothetical protein